MSRARDGSSTRKRDSDFAVEETGLSESNRDFIASNEEVFVNEKDEEITVKMIDFAHSTFDGFMDDPVVHIGPDHGYLKGLTTLIRLMESWLK